MKLEEYSSKHHYKSSPVSFKVVTIYHYILINDYRPHETENKF